MTIEIRSTTVFRGPNIWARMPAVLMELGSRFCEHRTELLPGLYEHNVSPSERT